MQRNQVFRTRCRGDTEADGEEPDAERAEADVKFE